MFLRRIQFVVLISTIALGFATVRAQNGADGMPVFSQPCQDKRLSKFEQESCSKMRIEQEKKEYDEMLKRGEEARRISERVVRSFEKTGTFSDDDRDLLASLEKNVKKIRDELGGDGDDEKIDKILGPDIKPTILNVFDKFKTSMADLMDELEKTTRFTTSASAIESSNDVLAAIRFLRSKN